MMWPSVPLAQLTRMVGGGTPSKRIDAFWNGTIPWISPKDMRGREVHDAEDHITEAAVESSATQVVPVGSVLVVVRSGILVRRLPIAITRVPVALNQDMKALLPGGPLLPEFLAYALEARADYVLSECVKRGATVHSIDVSKFQQLKLPLPAESEQRRIVELLNQADSLRRFRAEANAKAERILPALFLNIFGDPATNPKGWPTITLGTVLKDTQYGTSTRANEDGKGLPIIRMNNITNQGFLDLKDLKTVELSEKEVRKYLLSPGDILFNRTNSAELVGKTALWQGQFQAVPASYLIRVCVDRTVVAPEFVWAFMNTPFMKRVLFDKARRAIGMANINAEELRRLPSFVPPLPEQTKFARLVEAIEQGRQSRVLAEGQLECLFRSLLNRAFLGRLTGQWREAHIKELIQEMERQSRRIAAFPSPEAQA